MAKKSKIAREHKIIKNVQKYASLRKELKDIIKSPKSEFEDKKGKNLYSLSDPQVIAILELRLQKLTALGINEIEVEIKKISWSN